MSVNGRCCWVLVPNSPGVVAVYCGVRVGYNMVRDDDGNRVRKYKPFCPKHESQSHDNDEDDWGQWR